MRYLIPLITLLYLIIQSISDIKTKKVYVILNNGMICLSLIFYAWSMSGSACAWPTIIYPLLHVLFLWLFSKKFHFMGTGDAKAFFVLAFSLRYVSGLYPNIDWGLYAIAFFVSNVTFATAHYTNKFKRQNTNVENIKARQYASFFPNILIGYVVAYALGIIAYL